MSGARFQTSGAKGGRAHAWGVGNLRFQTYFTQALSWNTFYILDPKARSPPLDGNDRASPPRTRGSTSPCLRNSCGLIALTQVRQGWAVLIIFVPFDWVRFLFSVRAF